MHHKFSLQTHQRNESSPHPSIKPPGTSKKDSSRIAVGLVETNTLGLGMLSHHSSDPQTANLPSFRHHFSHCHGGDVHIPRVNINEHPISPNVTTLEVLIHSWDLHWNSRHSAQEVPPPCTPKFTMTGATTLGPGYIQRNPPDSVPGSGTFFNKKSHHKGGNMFPKKKAYEPWKSIRWIPNFPCKPWKR